MSDPIQQQYVYQCRVKAADAFDLARYEYWWGRQAGWRREPLARFDAETAVLWMSGQGQVVWNDFFGCYIFVRLGRSSRVSFPLPRLNHESQADDAQARAATTSSFEPPPRPRAPGRPMSVSSPRRPLARAD